MSFAADIIGNMLSISEFSRGGASRAFACAQEKPVVVVRNNAPIAVVISIDEFLRLSDMSDELDELRAKVGRTGSPRNAARKAGSSRAADAARLEEWASEDPEYVELEGVEPEDAAQ